MISRFHLPALCALLVFSTATLAQESSDAPSAQDTAATAQEPAAASSADAENSAATPAEAEPPAEATAAATPGGKVGSPAPGKGQIVFFRPSKFTGGAIGFKVREGETELGKLRSGKYFVASVEPGTHDYTVHSEAKDVLTMEVEAGETYYVQGTITMGFMAGRPNLSPSDEATFAGMADKLKLAE